MIDSNWLIRVLNIFLGECFGIVVSKYRVERAKFSGRSGFVISNDKGYVIVDEYFGIDSYGIDDVEGF